MMIRNYCRSISLLRVLRKFLKQRIRIIGEFAGIIISFTCIMVSIGVVWSLRISKYSLVRLPKKWVFINSMPGYILFADNCCNNFCLFPDFLSLNRMIILF